jgi:hypothetical protein
MADESDERIVMPATHSLRRTGLAIAIAAALPAALAPAADAGLRLQVKPDGAAPEGRTPKAVFSLLGASKGRKYKIEATQISGQKPDNEQGYPVICGSVLGGFSFTKADASKMVFDPTPLSSYELAWASPCTGTYKGEVLTPRRGAPSRVLQTFRLQVPAMRLTHVRIPRGRS